MSNASALAEEGSEGVAAKGVTTEGVTTDAPATMELPEEKEALPDTETTVAIEKKPSDGQNTTGDKVKNGKNYKNRDERRDHKGGRSRSKMPNEFDNLPESDDPEEIRAQVEFYFSKHNLSTDWHLFKEIGGAQNRPVPIKHIATFSRMRRFQPYSAIVDALRESEDLVVLDDGKFSGRGNEGVKRKEPIELPKSCDKPNLSLDDIFYRLRYTSNNDMDSSVYVKGFVEQGEDVGQIELEKFFKPYGAVMVRKRRDKDDRTFKGSVFVEFDTKEAQEEFLKLDPKPKFNDRDLLIMSKRAYSEMKCEEKGIIPNWKREDGENGDEDNHHDSNGRRNYRGRGRGRGRGGRRGRGGFGDRWPRRRSPDYNPPAHENRVSPQADSKRKRDASDNGDAPAQEKKTKMELKVDE